MTARHRRTRRSQVTVLDLQRRILMETLTEAYERTARDAGEKFGSGVEAASAALAQANAAIRAAAAEARRPAVVDIPAQKGLAETMVVDGREYVVVTGWAPKAPVGVESEWVLK